MPEPVTSYISSAWLEPLWKKLQAIRGERDAEIQRIKNDFVDPYDLARYYIEPNCQHHNPADHREDEEPRSAVKSPAFRTINDFLEGDYAVTRSGKTQMFILSDAGMGKTSLLVMLKLAHLTRFWPGQQHCELLKLGPDTLDRVKAIPEAGDTVLLLDALDEDRAAWRKIESRLLEILDQTSHFRRVIISCRTQFFPEISADPFGNPGRVELGGFVCPMLFLSLFDDHQVAAYLEKRYPNQWFGWFGANTKREQARRLVDKMKDLRCRPMLLAHIEDLVGSALTEWTEYAVYEALVKAWLNREEKKLRQEGHPNVTADTLLAACRLVACHMQRSGARFLSEPKLTELIQAQPEFSPVTQIGFGGRSLLNRNAQADYRFSHFSIQEYLVAQEVFQQCQSQERLAQTTHSPSGVATEWSAGWQPALGVGKPPSRLPVGAPSEVYESSGLIVPAYSSEKVIRFVLDGRTKLCPNKPLVLRGLNLAKFDLKGMDLSGADLSGANLSGADLSGAQLDGANLENAKLVGANLTGVILTEPIAGLPFTQPLNDTVKLEFIWIPPGKFLMGKAGREQVEVTLIQGFWMGKYPVTQEEYQAITGDNPSGFKQVGPRAPVEKVNWEDASAFCQELTEHLASLAHPRNAGSGDARSGDPAYRDRAANAVGRVPSRGEEPGTLVGRVPSRGGESPRQAEDETSGPASTLQCRLPTEAEWEYACRAGTTTQYSFGDSPSDLGDYAWYNKNSGGKTHPVGQKQPNPWGLYDMHGHIWEWCQDWYGPYPKGPVTDPTGPAKGEYRVLRGGSWCSSGPACLSCSYRFSGQPLVRNDGGGFRCVWCVWGSAPR